MARARISACLLVLLLTGTAQAQSVGGVPDAASTPQSTLPMSDKHFVDSAAMAFLAEMQNGSLAKEKGDATVKTIGNMIMADDTATNTKLLEIAQANDVTPPTTQSGPDQETASKLGGKNGPAFDSAYLAAERRSYVAAIALFKKEAATGQTPALKTYAQDSLPTLEHHLATIETALAR